MPGLVASSAWKKARFKESWREGETLSVSIGQGYNLATPIQMAQVAAAIANGGCLYEPQLVEKVESPSGEILFEAKPVLRSSLGAAPATLAAVQKALADVVNDEDGTGKAAQLPEVEVAGKTGTSQVVATEWLDLQKKGSKKVLVGHKYENHAWFVAYAPASDPQIAVAVLIEHGGHGGSGAAPLAKRILAAKFPEKRVAKSK